MLRRQFLQILGGGAVCLVSSNYSYSLAADEGPRAEVLETRVISPRATVYHGWSTVTRLKNNDLWVVWSGEREQHVCPFGQVQAMVSHDQGKTWSWPRTLLDSDLDDRDAGIVETPQGSLLVTTFTSVAYVPLLEAAQQHSSWPADRLSRWQSAHRRLNDEQRRGMLASWMLRSTDGGSTWSAAYRCPVNSPHGPVALSDQRLLYAGKALWADHERVGFCVSADDGVTWDWLADLPIRPGDSPEHYHELHAVEAANGMLIAQIRNENEAHRNETLQSESLDGGRTWSMPHSIDVWGLPSHLLRLRDGRLLMSYGHRRPPFGNQGRLSSDHGKSWSAPLAISVDGADGDLGYPSTVELTDGTLVTIWYEHLAGTEVAQLRQAHWKIVP